MDAPKVLLEQWTRQVKQLFPQWHVYQQESFALAVLGTVMAGQAVLQRVAETLWLELPEPLEMSSYERRLQRLVANERIEITASWQQFQQQVLPCWQGQEVTLVLDCTPYAREATIVYLGLLVQSRVLPIAYVVMPQQEHWDESQWSIVERMFAQVAPSLQTACCTLLADRGLSCLELIRLCQKQGWHYLLRIKNEEWVRRCQGRRLRDWQQGKDLIGQPGQQWYGQVMLWKEHEFMCSLSACWQPGCQEAWFLISDEPAGKRQVRRYGWRMRVEATFQDSKSRGWQIEASRFRDREHLARWLLVVFVAIWWTAHLGTSCVHHGHRRLLDRADRRDKSLLRLGRLWLLRILKEVQRDQHHRASLLAARLANCLPFHRGEGGLRFAMCLR